MGILQPVAKSILDSFANVGFVFLGTFWRKAEGSRNDPKRNDSFLANDQKAHGIRKQERLYKVDWVFAFLTKILMATI